MAGEKRKLSVKAAIDWAFGVEKADLDLPDLRNVDDRGYGFGTEYIIMQRMRLGGVRIEGGGRSAPHDDADIIAATVATMPRRLGGRAMAIEVARCGRLLTTPDWMPGAKAELEPIDWTGRGRNRKAKEEVKRRYTKTVTTPHPKNPAKTISRKVEVKETWCLISWVLHPDTIKSARVEYMMWWHAIRYVRDQLIVDGLLSDIEITDTLPRLRPWKDELAGAHLSTSPSPEPQSPAGH